MEGTNGNCASVAFEILIDDLSNHKSWTSRIGLTEGSQWRWDVYLVIDSQATLFVFGVLFVDLHVITRSIYSLLRVTIHYEISLANNSHFTIRGYLANNIMSKNHHIINILSLGRVDVNLNVEIYKHTEYSHIHTRSFAVNDKKQWYKVIHDGYKYYYYYYALLYQ